MSSVFCGRLATVSDDFLDTQSYCEIDDLRCLGYVREVFSAFFKTEIS